MKKFSLSLSEEEFQSSLLVGIRSFLEIHRLAYLLNRDISAAFSRCDDFFDSETQTTYALYSWTNVDDENWYLVENQPTEIKSVSIGLFEEMEQNSVFIKEHKKMDYFLKIENTSSSFDLEEFLENLRQIPQIQYVQKIELNTSKIKNKFIFKNIKLC